MTDDIRALTARLAEEPNSLAFLELAETLRGRGQLDAALKVARGGVSRYPGLADAHDLLARILCDRGDLGGAFDAWSDTLRIDPLRTAALKGIAFLYFRAGDEAAARAHLERALEADPDDATISAALARLRAPAAQPSTAADASPPSLPSAATPPPPADAGILLVDGSGMRLSGTMTDARQRDVSDAVAAELAGVSKEAARTTRLLDLGPWDSIAIESPDGHVVLVAPTPETILLAARGADVPMARVGLLAERAARDARAWLEHEA